MVVVCPSIALAAWTAFLLLGQAGPAHAQLLSRYIPDYAPGLTASPEDVQTRILPDYRSDGVRSGSFVIRPRLTESFGYDSNVDGLTGGKASPVIATEAALDVQSDWSRNSVAAQLSVDDQRYPSRGMQDFTNWSAGVSGSYDIGLEQVSGGYQHLNVVQTPRDLGALAPVPVPFQVDDVRIDTTLLSRSRLSFVPSIEVVSYRFSDITGALGATQAQAETLLSRVIYQGELTTRYELSANRHLVLVLRGTVVDFASHPPGVGDRNSDGGAVLVGIDTTGGGPFRYRALIGYQERDYGSVQYAAIRSPIIEASVTWTPQRLTTLTGILRREIDDSTDVNFTAATTTSVQLNVAHELRRNVVLTGFAEYQRAEFNARSATVSPGTTAGTQSIYSAGVGATWFANRRTRVGLSDQFIDRRGGMQFSYLENVALLTVGFGL